MAGAMPWQSGTRGFANTADPNHELGQIRAGQALLGAVSRRPEKRLGSHWPCVHAQALAACFNSSMQFRVSQPTHSRLGHLCFGLAADSGRSRSLAPTEG